MAKKDKPVVEEDTTVTTTDVEVMDTAPAAVDPKPAKKGSGPVQVVADAKAKYLKDPFTGQTYTSRSKVDVNEIKEGGWLDCQIKAGLLHIVK